MNFILSNWSKKFFFKFFSQYADSATIQNGKFYNLIPAWFIKQLITDMGYAIYETKGILIELNPISKIDRKIISEQGHDPIISDLIFEHLAQGGTFLDIGANVGYFSLIAAKLPNVKVLAFEPSPREIIRLYRNIALNNLGNITVFPYGLAEQEQVMSLNLAGMWNPGMNSVVNLKNQTEECVDCYFSTLDSLVPHSIISDIRLCKIDVEGMELSVLKGIRKSIKLMNKAVFIVEIDSGYLSKAGCKPKDIYDFFETYDYQPQFGLFELQDFDGYKEKNEVFIKSN